MKSRGPIYAVKTCVRDMCKRSSILSARTPIHLLLFSHISTAPSAVGRRCLVVTVAATTTDGGGGGGSSRVCGDDRNGALCNLIGPSLTLLLARRVSSCSARRRRRNNRRRRVHRHFESRAPPRLASHHVTIFRSSHSHPSTSLLSTTLKLT